MVVLSSVVGAANSAAQPVAAERGPTPPAPTYDAADLDARIAAASTRAREENRRVLIAWGSNTDRSSQAFIELTAKSSAVSRKLLYEYEVVRADAAGNEALAARFGAHLKEGAVPWLTVLDAGGQVIANESAAAFKASTGSSVFDAEAVVAFLTRHQAAYLDAKTLLAGALSRAKKDQKTLFLWFSAPW